MKRLEQGQANWNKVTPYINGSMGIQAKYFNYINKYTVLLVYLLP